jgi:hypothetical protein
MDKASPCGGEDCRFNSYRAHMKSKNLIVLVIILIVAGAIAAFYFPQSKNYILNFLQKNQPTSQPASQTETINFQDKQITDNTKPFVIKITYPYVTGLDGFNEKVMDAVNKELSNFKTNSLENDAAVKQVDPVSYAKFPREYTLDISYTKGQINENIASVILNVYNFEGGAHGASYFVPINYNVKDKKEIALADLFESQPDYLQKISDYCTKNLTEQMTKSGAIDMSNTEWLKEGAGPKAENFQFFLINPSPNSGQATITFYFPQYQVAAYAAGDFQVTMPR